MHCKVKTERCAEDAQTWMNCNEQSQKCFQIRSRRMKRGNAMSEEFRKDTEQVSSEENTGAAENAQQKTGGIYRTERTAHRGKGKRFCR